ncbi:MAG TPA: protein kinase, partial [Thermoanaerobaculia bacterium]|nr:protein kinase [Thermoanaerobaculia bacterium]
LISQLSHPNICTLFDVGSDYIVMERLHGETLSARIERGPMPLRDVIRYGAEIAEALEAAHRSGVVHRDLKPGNVMITKNGAKLLDFGLAKTTLIELSSGATGRMTAEGTVVGTLQHMSPEQLQAKPVDPRMDIYALGTVLYEMITGVPAVDGSVPSAMVIAAIMGADPPPMSRFRPDIPPALEHLVRVCLAKDPEGRWQSAHDVAEQLRWLSGDVGTQPIVLPPLRNRARRIVAVTAGAAALAGLMTLAWLVRPKESLRFSIDPPDDIRALDPNAGGGIDVSPDGHTVVFAGRDGTGVVRLYLRDLDNFTTRPLAGTEGASYPFWSPKGEDIAFFAQGKLRRVPRGGGVAADIAEAPDGRGGDWTSRDEIVFSPTITSPLMRVAARGGAVTPATALRPKELSHRFPSVFPDGDHLLYYVSGGAQGVHLGSMTNRTSRLLLPLPASAYAAGDDRILFVRNGLLMVQHVDLDSMALTGEPHQVAQNVGIAGDRRYQAIAASPSGTLVFVAEPIRRMRIVLRDRNGRLLGTVGPAGDYHEPVLDPSGTKILVTEEPPGEPLRLMEIDLQDGRARRVAADDMGSTPVVAPDNSRLLFFLATANGDGLFELPRGTSVIRMVARLDGARWPDSMTPDGQQVVLEGQAAGGRTKSDLWLLRMDDRKLRPLLASAA